MLRKGLLRRESVHRIAIVGPGLDFANKENGSDFYPLQTIQPFAVLDSLRQLGLADLRSVEIYTLDISPTRTMPRMAGLLAAAEYRSGENIMFGPWATTPASWNRHPSLRASRCEYAWRALLVPFDLRRSCALVHVPMAGQRTAVGCPTVRDRSWGGRGDDI
jgi:hypothetical protein